MTPAPTSLDPQAFLRRLLEQAHALVLLAPALFLVWPGALSPIAGDPFPIPTGTGVAGVSATLGLAFLITRRVRPAARWVAPYLGFVALGYLALRLDAPSDTFGASRATLLAAVSVTALAGGASLGRAGIVALARGLVTLSLLAVVPALLDGTNQFAGRLGNTGSTSEVALLGAAAGAWLALGAEQRLWRLVGALAAGAYALYVGVAPVLAGAASFGTLLALLALASKDTRRMALVLAGACALLFGAGRLIPHPQLPASSRPAANAPGDTGGLAVRRLLWGSLPAMVSDYGLLGAGHGQFQSAYPPYRDAREIELSSHERTLPAAETEVEHAHSDVLQAFVDAGWLGGSLWLLFLAAVAWTSWKLVLDPFESARAPLAAAALAVLANALLREPLLWNPASATASFALFGVLLAKDPGPAVPGPRGWLRNGLVVVAIVLVATQLARAWSMAWHGRTLAQYVSTGNEAFSELALDVCEDSPLALSTRARQLEAKAGDQPSERVIEAWRAVLAVRPHNVEALTQAGIALARAERVDEARLAWSHALALDPGHPAVRRNLARLEALLGDIDAAEEHLRTAGSDVGATLRGYGFAALRELRVERGFELLARADARFALLGPELAFELAKDAATGTEDERLALEGVAHLLWAREHGGRGAADDAVRSYRQAKRCLAPRDGRPLQGALALELAAALAAAGRVPDARAELGGRTITGLEVARLPEWAGQALLENGLLGS